MEKSITSFATALLLIAAGLLPTFSYAQPGSLDLSFDNDGLVTTVIGGGYDAGYSVAIQSDGKIVVAGYSNNNSNFDFALVRYNPDGSLDDTFDSDGIVTTAIGSGDDYGYSVAIQSDGKIVVAGLSFNGSNYDFALVRYNADGSLDNTFGSNGIVTTVIGSSSDFAYSVAIQNDGKIVVAGGSYNGSNYDFALVRYNVDGSLNNTFDNDGIVTTAIGSGDGHGHSIAIQSDGKIVVAGYGDNGSNLDFAIVRYNANGSLDNTFDSDGKVTTAIGSGDDLGFSVAIQSDGKIVVAGYNSNGNASNGHYYTLSNFTVVRYNIDGSLDNSFNSDGKATTGFGGTYNWGGYVAIQCDAKIVVAGGYSSGHTLDAKFALIRYNADGSLDNTFDSDGKVTTDFGNRNNEGTSVAIQSDGKIVVAGGSYNGSDNDFALARYMGSATMLELGPSIIACSDDTIILNAGAGKGSYLWSTGASTQTIQVKSPDPQQVYTDTISVFAPEGVCKSRDTIAITILPSPVITTLADHSKICINDSVILKGNGGFANYLWDNGSTDTFLVANLNALHWLQVTNSYGCSTKKFSTVVVVDSASTLLNLGSDRLVCNGTSVTLYAGDEFDSYLWQDGSTGSSFVGSKAGNYSVVVTNICGSASDEVTLGFWNIFIPNLFTPDNDGHNDIFSVQGIEKGEWKLSIYNRWGERVYFSAHYDNSWSGGGLSQGVYYYSLEEESACNKFNGWLDIKR
jgi:uncharacterized delta-60 repeat protein/gliding motility-associated-like protein